jgi:predicted RNase H-like nuclease
MTLKQDWVAGVDGCRAGWVVVLLEIGTGASRLLGCRTFSEVLALPEQPKVIAVDVPIGLLDRGEPGGRACDREARTILGRQGVRVFSAPTVPALDAYILGGDHATVSAANRTSSDAGIGLSRQAFCIMNKISEVDAEMTPRLQEIVYEIHPEVSFRRANDGTPVAAPKRGASGRARRAAIVEELGFPSDRFLTRPRPLDSKPDDILDAAVACWTAFLIEKKDASSIPLAPPLSSRGLTMAIWH